MTVSPEALVNAAYRTFLGREPDVGGGSSWTHLLENGLSLEEFFSRFLGGEEFPLGFTNFLRRVNIHNRVRFVNDHSQHGEIAYFIESLVREAPIVPQVVDIGARGRERSNSYDLMKCFGWSGLLVEANPNLIGQIEKEFEGLPFTLLSTAISDFEGRAEFTLGINDDVSSLDPAASKGWGPTQGSFEVSVLRLHAVLDQYKIDRRFGLLSLDIEGEDVKVLNDLILNSSYRPSWIIIETTTDKDFVEDVYRHYVILKRIGSNLILKLRAE